MSLLWVLASTCPTCFIMVLPLSGFRKLCFEILGSEECRRREEGKEKEWIMEERKKGQTPTTPQQSSGWFDSYRQRHEHTHTPAYTLAFYATKKWILSHQKVLPSPSWHKPFSVTLLVALEYETLSKASRFLQVGRHWRVVVKLDIILCYSAAQETTSGLFICER